MAANSPYLQLLGIIITLFFGNARGLSDVAPRRSRSRGRRISRRRDGFTRTDWGY